MRWKNNSVGAAEARPALESKRPSQRGPFCFSDEIHLGIWPGERFADAYGLGVGALITSSMVGVVGTFTCQMLYSVTKAALLR